MGPAFTGQGTTWKHAEQLGVGYSSLEGGNLIFALAWESVTLEERPRFGDVVRVHTSLAGMTRLYFYRDFTIFDEDSEVLIQAHTAWICLDTDSRRPQRLGGLSRKFDFPSLSEPSGRKKLEFTPPDKGWRQYSMSVLPSDLDVYYHANNLQCVSWVMDGLPLEFFASHELQNFQIQYREELHCGDRLLIETNEKGTTTFHRITREDDQSEVARAKSVWSPK